MCGLPARQGICQRCCSSARHRLPIEAVGPHTPREIRCPPVTIILSTTLSPVVVTSQGDAFSRRLALTAAQSFQRQSPSARPHNGRELSPADSEVPQENPP